MILRKSTLLFKNPPSIGQFAVNGMWENALSFKVHSPPLMDEIRGYLADGHELAFELFFGESFFGVRFIGTPDLILELSQHCLKCMQRSADANSFIKALGNHSFCGELCHEISHMEIGAVNAWKSVGSYILPPPKQVLANIEELWSSIYATPLAKDTNHPKAIELTYSEPLPHWIGFPISLQKPPYSLRKNMFLDVLQNY